MADPLAIISLTATILKEGYEYLSSVKKAPQDLRMILNEVAALDTVLGQLEILASTKTNALNAFQKIARTGALEDCRAILSDVQTSIDKCRQIEGQRRKNLQKALLWPFKESDTREMLAKLCRLREAFTAALSVDTIATVQRLERTGEEIKLSINTLQTLTEQRFSEESSRSLLNWLCEGRASVHDNYDTAMQHHEPGTGEWLLDSLEFQNWVLRKNGLMWLHGIPGSGKTILSAVVIRSLGAIISPDDTGLAYFYCDHKDPNKQTVRSFLTTVCFQLLGQHQDCMADVEHLFTTYKKDLSREPRLEDLRDIFKTFSTHFRQVWVVIDALDECHERVAFLETIEYLLRKDTSIQLFVTSRKISSIERILGSQADFSISLGSKLLAQDLAAFVHAQTDARIRTKRLKLRDPKLRDEIVSALVGGADGMFLWAKVQMDRICGLKNDKSIRKALVSLPSGLEETYVYILQQLRIENADNLDEIKHILSWLVGCHTPLALEQLAEVIAVNSSDKERDLEAICTDPEDLLEMCGSLVGIDRSTEPWIIQLAHFSIEEYLTSSRILESPVREFYMGPPGLPTNSPKLAEVLLQYLSFQDFALPCSPDRYNLQKRLKEYPLLRYAAMFWWRHLKEWESFRSDGSHLNKKYIQWFINPGIEGRQFESWQQVFHNISREGPADPPLYYVAQFGSTYLLKLLLEIRKVNINTMFVSGVTAVHIAAQRGDVAFLRALIKEGADIDIPSERRLLTPLHIACENGHKVAVEILLAAGANIHQKSDAGTTPFYRASRSGSLDILNLLHSRGSDVNASTWDGWTAIYEAVERDHLSAVAQLIEWGADLKKTNRQHQTPLDLAVKLRRRRIIKLLQNGVGGGA